MAGIKWARNNNRNYRKLHVGDWLYLAREVTLARQKVKGVSMRNGKWSSVSQMQGRFTVIIVEVDMSDDCGHPKPKRAEGNAILILAGINNSLV